MRRKIPSTRWLAIAVAGACIALAAALSTSSPAAVDSTVKISAGHPCLVMTGSGDPTFTKNFNPYTATGLPLSLQIMCRPYDEATALRIGWAYQQATDWHLRVPRETPL